MKTMITLLFACLVTSLSIAQEQKITKGELNKFAEAYQEVRLANQTSQQKMMKAVTEEDLTVERFNIINQAEQNPNKEVDATDDELKNYQAAMESVEKIQKDIEMQLQTKIKEAGLTLERFQQIANQMKTDKALQQRLAILMQS
jgi:hypothetical protein